MFHSASFRWVLCFAATILFAGGTESALGAPSDIVFAARALGAKPDAASRTTAIERARSGKLLVLSRDDNLRALVDASTPGADASTPVDVMDPDVSFDGTRVVFAGYSSAEDAWRIYEVAADGTGLRQITRSDREIDLTRYGDAAPLLESYDDVDPCYLPDGRICFVSNRYPGTAPDGRLRATNLYVVNADGSELHRITTERFGADTPAVEPSTGRIVYSRWWRTAQVVVDASGEPEPVEPGSPEYAGIVFDQSNLVLRGVRMGEFPGINSWFLAGIDPDGTDLAMWSGVALDRELTQAYRPAFLDDGEAVALFIPRTPFIGYPRGNGLRRFSAGPRAPAPLGGPQVFPPPPGVEVDPIEPGPEYFYASVSVLEDQRLLLSAAPTRAAEADYGIYVQSNDDARPELIYNDPDLAELDAVPLAARAVPPVIPDDDLEPLPAASPRSVGEAYAQGGKFLFSVENINANAGLDVPLPNAIPIGQKLAIEFYMGPQLTSTTASDKPLLIERRDIPPDGKVEIELPAGVPLFEVLRRTDDTIPLGRDGQIFHVGGMNFNRAGVSSSCVGCHAGHTQIQVPEDPAWTNVAPSAFVVASSVRDPGRDSPFRPVNAVDRRTDRIWGAETKNVTARLDLRWSTTIRAREVVVYAPERNDANNQIIRAFEVTTILNRMPQQTLRIEDEMRADGTVVPLDPEIDFDSLVVAVQPPDVTGLFDGGSGPAIAEVTVVARVTGEPRFSFSRGDVDCNGNVNISDPVITLNALFAGGGSGICCQAAADTNDDQSVNIADPIFILNFLFGGGPAPNQPFGQCGPAADEGLPCDSICP